MESKGFSEKHRVTYYETDMNGTVGLGRLVDLMMLSCNAMPLAFQAKKSIRWA